MTTPEAQHTRLQLDLMRTHVREAARIAENYEMLISPTERDDLLDRLNESLETIDILLEYVDDEIETDFLTQLYNR